jgi:hypothetical protein
VKAEMINWNISYEGIEKAPVKQGRKFEPDSIS